MSDSSGVYICKSIVNDLRRGNYICKSEGMDCKFLPSGSRTQHTTDAKHDIFSVAIVSQDSILNVTNKLPTTANTSSDWSIEPLRYRNAPADSNISSMMILISLVMLYMIAIVVSMFV